ncbi:pyridoxine kinase [Dongia mobilis]|uniref:pyridoxal kinase n=1 Tax=Dongia mobilis TaxID=578943 RepID=A0A4R6WSR9_9PROT|nr:pyridoxal kinase [Dongia mobilis]TDQ82104.1 pyridoxine kinase [Dongia mobilis]
MPILSIQSEVVYGHVGHQASRFILERMGHPVWAAPTVVFSNHLGHKTVTGRVLPASEVRELIDGLRQLDVLKQANTVLTGYLGAPETAALVAEVVAEVKAANPDALFICDPVIGDQGSMYVKPELAQALAEILVPIADVLSPNVYELGHLTGREVRSRAQAVEALHALAARSAARIVIGTGIPDPDHPEELAVLALARAHGHDVAPVAMTTTRRHPIFASGTGDAFTALFTASYRRDPHLQSTLDRAVAAMAIIVGETAATGSDELKIIETQEDWVAALKK